MLEKKGFIRIKKQIRALKKVTVRNEVNEKFYKKNFRFPYLNFKKTSLGG